MSIDDIPSGQTDASLAFHKYLRCQIEWIGILRGELKSLRIRSPFFEAELWGIHKNIQKLREDEESYFSREKACNITNWSVYVLTTTLVEKAKSELSELEKDWQVQFKRY